MRGRGGMRQAVMGGAVLLWLCGAGTPSAHASDLYGNGSDLEADLRRMLESNELEKRRAAVDRLAGLEMRIAAPYLMEKLRDGEPGVRARAARALGPGAVLDAAPLLLSCVSDVEVTVRAACVEAFGQYGALPPELQKRAATTLARVMTDAQYEVRLEVLRALERLVRTEALSIDEQLHLLGPALLRSEDEHVVVRRAACSLLGHLATSSKDARKRIAVALLGRLSDPARDVRLEAISSLTRLGDPSAAAAALRLLSDPADDVRRQAVLYLGQAGYVPALPILSDLLLHAPEPLRQSAAQSLATLLRGLPASTTQPGADSPAVKAALFALVDGLEREEIRPASRMALLRLRDRALPVLLHQLQVPGASASRVRAVVDLLRDLVRDPARDPARDPLRDLARDLGADPLLSSRDAAAEPALRADAKAPVAAALVAELGRSRIARDRVVAALAALDDPAQLPLYLALTADADAAVQAQALRALARLPQLDDRCTDALVTLSRGADAGLRAQVAPLLGRVLSPASLARLRDLLRDPSTEVRAAAVQGLTQAARTAAATGQTGALGSSEVASLTALITVSADNPVEARLHRAAAQTLGQLAATSPAIRAQVVNAIVVALRGLRPSPAAQDLVTALGAALRGVTGSSSPPPDLAIARSLLLDLATASGDADGDSALVAADALDALAALGDPAVVGRVARLLSHGDPLRRMRAAAALGSLLAQPGGDSGRSALISLLQSERSSAVVAEAAWALGKGSPDLSANAVAALRRLLAAREGMGGERAVRVNALGALARLGRAEPADASWLWEGEPLARANGALLLSSLADRTPGLSARLANLAATDIDHRVRHAAAQALRGVGPSARAARTLFVGMVQQDVDRQPLSDTPFRWTGPDGLSRIAVTDRRGVFREEQVPPGPCEVEPLGDLQ